MYRLINIEEEEPRLIHPVEDKEVFKLANNKEELRVFTNIVEEFFIVTHLAS